MTIGVHEFWSFLLLFARVTALCVTAPVFGHRTIPRPAKVALAGLFSLALLPLIAPKVSAAPTDMLSLIGGILAETVVGLCLGFLVTLLMSAFQMAGYYVDTQMGFGIINILNPFSEQQTSAMGQFLYQTALTLFLVSGGHLLLLGTLASSYTAIAPGGAHFSGDLASAFTGIVGQLFVLAFRIAAPAAAVLMVVDVAFAIVARAVPQMNIFMVGMPIKVIVGLLTLALLLPVLAMVVGQMPGLMGTGLKALFQAMR